MPVVLVEMWEGRTIEQKRALVRAITDAMVQHAGARPDHLHVIIHDVPRHNWGRAGILGCDLAETPASGTPGAAADGGSAAILSHLLLQVQDLARSEAFFTGVLGFTVRRRDTLRDGRPLTVLHQGVGLAPFPTGDHPVGLRVDHIAFRVPDLQVVIQRLERAGISYEVPVTTQTYGTSIYVRDPDGNRIELHDR